MFENFEQISFPIENQLNKSKQNLDMNKIEQFHIGPNLKDLENSPYNLKFDKQKIYEDYSKINSSKESKFFLNLRK